MSITIGSNISSLRAQANLSKTQYEQSKVYERLSSGLRVNTAADDAGGLMMADKLRSQSKLLSIALRNANDGLSYATVADTGLASAAQLLVRMGELANQSANAVYTTSQRSAMAYEFAALGSEIDRVAQTNTFNGLGTISNSSSITIQVGFDSDASSRITMASVVGTLSSLGLSNGSSLTFSINAANTDLAVTASRLALTAINAALESITQQRGVIGANTSRLQFAIENLSVTRDNFVAAEAAIRDTDIAADAAAMVRLQVLAQAQTAILAQANQQPALVLRLLG
jgi:flagellin